MEIADKGKTLDDGIRDEEQFRHLGFWSDGRKVIQPIVGVDLDSIPRVIPGNGLRLFPWGLSAKPKAAVDGEIGASDRAVVLIETLPIPTNPLSRTRSGTGPAFGLNPARVASDTLN